MNCVIGEGSKSYKIRFIWRGTMPSFTGRSNYYLLKILDTDHILLLTELTN